MKPNQTEGSTGVESPTWYTENEMYQWLIRENYSEQIAKELSGKYATYLQGAFNKGYEKGSRETACIAALKELIPIAEAGQAYYRQNPGFDWVKEREKSKSAIERAKRLTDGKETI